LTLLKCTVPLGVTLHDCVAVPPLEVAESEKLLATRDCAGVGVHVMVLPLRVAPWGPDDNVSVTDFPAGSTAEIW
jgi:hypothetical protein